MLYEAVVVGVSAGGMQALSVILPELSSAFAMPVIIVQHRRQDDCDFLVRHLNEVGVINVSEVISRRPVAAPGVYVAPAGYHLLVERDRTFGLSLDPKVNHAIPSIDVLFESAAEVYQEKLVGLILTGANSDGAQGLAKIKAYGGLTITQDVTTAAVPYMPQVAAKSVAVDHVLPLQDIGAFLCALDNK